ncbi:hypothetical protein LT17_03731 [Pseudomonas aeruginosa]|uniref:YiiX/YebB-like N1pC/P60 family cysteine hydrolase n=1 Tax=Pseudomonas aeruginosa TaxID=287 RepID=UPI000794782F|nr:YiiX/YebB-like N1pC/P60 family cysteine hydrolase [Pseudomonas aeruginosa]KXG14939.1 hypothetical protein LT17_03731 [Pseudomonas aeruginosa]RTR54486.1 hypothetical protein DY931_32105 [Pseudomonas aeruginosa]RTR63983.1 hypothetical protein DY930_34285 [Pseudomonas aeruginosa]
MDIQAGDVFLMCGDAKHSKYLANAQRLIYRNAKSSHVLVSLADGAFVHATTGAGVDFEFITTILNDCKEGWRVIRMKGLTDERREAIMKESLYFIDQAYNYKFFFKSNDSSSFCSELVAKVFESAGAPLFNKETGKVTPADFDKAADEGSLWEDVTENYRISLTEINQNLQLYMLGYSTMIASIRKRQAMMQSTDKLLARLKIAAEKGDISQNLYEKAISMESQFRQNKNISFWNEKKYPAPDQSEE